MKEKKKLKDIVGSFGKKIQNISSRPNFVFQVLAAALVGFLALPFVLFLFSLFQEGGDFSLESFKVAFASRTSIHIIQQTLVLSLGSAFFAFLIGLPLGFLFCATDFPLRKLFLWASIFPLFIPPFLWAMGWEFILGRRGYLEELLWNGTGDYLGAFLFSIPGAIFVFGLYFSGLTVLSALWFIKMPAKKYEINPEKSWIKNFFHFIYAFSKSSVAWMAFFFTALMVFREFGASSILGLETVSTEIFSYFSTFYNLESVAAPGIIAITMTLVLWAFWTFCFKKKLLSNDLTNLTSGHPLISIGKKGSFLFWIMLFVMTAFYFFPLWIFFIRSEGISFLWQGLEIGFGSILRTVAYSAVTALMLVFISQFVGRLIRVSQGLYAGILDNVLAFMFFFPGVLTGVLLNRFWFHKWGAWVYTTFAIVILGIITQYVYPLIFGKRVFSQFNTVSRPEQAEGHRVKNILKKIAAPLKDVRFLTLAMIALIISLREFSSTVLLYPAGQETLLAKLYSLKNMETEPVLSSLAFYYLILMAVPFIVILIQSKKMFKKS